MSRFKALDPPTQALDRFLGGVKLVLECVPAEGAAPQSEEETIVGMLQRVLHPRLKSQLSESNLAVRQVRDRVMTCECSSDFARAKA